jgi:hypothetical protein
VNKICGVQLTKRDIEIIHFINEFGFCEMPQIEKRFAIKKPLSYRLLRRLIRAELVNHRRIFHLNYGIYYLTANGAKCTDLPPIGTFSMGRYEHQCRVTDVYIRLRQQYPDTDWISERRLKHEKYYAGVGKSGHLSDGVLVFPDEKQVAIEVELSLKGKERIKRILKNYSTQFSIKEVWYYCLPGMVSSLSILAAKMPFVKVYNLREFLHGRQ